MFFRRPRREGIIGIPGSTFHFFSSSLPVWRGEGLEAYALVYGAVCPPPPPPPLLHSPRPPSPPTSRTRALHNPQQGEVAKGITGEDEEKEEEEGGH